MHRLSGRLVDRRELHSIAIVADALVKAVVFSSDLAVEVRGGGTLRGPGWGTVSPVEVKLFSFNSCVGLRWDAALAASDPSV
jgi:hypothetical protein